MKPADYPIEYLAALQGSLQRAAEEEHLAARNAATDQHPALQHGYSEAAFAYACAAASVNDVMQSTMAFLDRKAVAENAAQVDPHQWPIPNLVNIDDERRNDRTTEYRQRYPHWGIAVDGRHDDAWIAAGPSRNPSSEILLFIGDRFSDTYANLESGHLLSVGIDQWRALNQLVEHIAAEKPVPYNVDGDVHVSAG
jgi:hypothetical protein